MKSKLIILFASLSILTFGQNKDSNHQFDKTLKCSTCHECEVPTKQNPCIQPCPRESMISIDVPPEKGPDFLTIDKNKKQSDIYQPVLFSHRLHAEMSGMSGGCRMCHHYNPPGKVIGCSDCHELKRKREDVSKPDLIGAYHRQCMDCHRGYTNGVECISCHQYNNINNEVASQKFSHQSPKRVHPDISAPGKLQYNTPKAPGKLTTFYHIDHTNLFGLKCDNCHSNESCNKCHAIEKAASNNKTVKEKHSICSSCHDTNNSGKCNMCHSDKTLPGFDHLKRTGFKITEYHGKLSCDRCHVSKPNFTGLKKDCIICHGKWALDNFNHKVTGLKLDEIHGEMECENCHKEPTFAKQTCNDCHEDKIYPKDKPGKLVKL